MPAASATLLRIAILRRGEVIAMGTMAQLRAAAADPNSALEDIFLQLTEEGRT